MIERTNVTICDANRCDEHVLTKDIVEMPGWYVGTIVDCNNGMSATWQACSQEHVASATKEALERAYDIEDQR